MDATEARDPEEHAPPTPDAAADGAPDRPAPADQAARAQLREGALKFWLWACGRAIELHLHDRTVVKARLEAVDSEEEFLLVSSLETAIGTVKRARIRCSDVISFSLLDD